MENILIGRNAVIEALKAGNPIEKIFILYGAHGGSIGVIRHRAKQKGVPCVKVDKQKFQDLVGRGRAAQGVAALVGMKQYIELEDILDVAAARGEATFVLVLDEIEDPQNLGALLRTAECTGVHGVVIPRHHAVAVSATVVKASAGASEHVPVAKVTNIASCLEELKERGVWIVGSAVDGDKVFTGIDYSMPVALVIGSEGKGIRKLVKEKCDFLVKIPLAGKVESLNASVAGALLMYEVLRKRKKL